MKRLILFLGLLFILQISLHSQYIKVLKEASSIRNGASTTSSIICQANTGDIFEVKETIGDWISIKIGFGKESRYIHKSLCQSISDLPQLPDKSTCKNAFLDFRRCEARSQRSADSEISVNSSNYLKRLKESEGKFYSIYLMDTFHKLKIAPALYDKIVELGFKEGWNNINL